MLQTLKNAWKTKDIRSKIIFTLFILALYRLGTVIPVPFVDATSFASSFSGTILDYMNTLSGGSLGSATIFALGVSPYINASIIIQLLAVVFPKLGELAKNDKEKMNFITRIVTIALAIVTAIGYYLLLAREPSQGAGNALSPIVNNSPVSWLYAIVIIACYCAGASVVMWLAERINEKGIGNGISIILFANIISIIPSQVYNLVQLVIQTYQYKDLAWLYGIVSTLVTLLVFAVMIALVVFVIFITGSERRIPVQYAKRVVGRKMYGGQSSNLPIKLNMTGVMPIIFASSIVSLIPTIITIAGGSDVKTGFVGALNTIFATDGVVYPVSLFILIIGFAYFYTTITFDPTEVANNLKKQGGTIPGIRQGRPTADYIRKILFKVTLVGALFLGVIAVLPNILGPHVFENVLRWIVYGSEDAKIALEGGYASSYDSYAAGLASMFTFGGTSLLIVVGVAIETFRELEAQLTMRNYKGFL